MKSLAQQGSVYVRLTREVESPTSSPGSSPHIRSPLRKQKCQPLEPPSALCAQAWVPVTISDDDVIISSVDSPPHPISPRSSQHCPFSSHSNGSSLPRSTNPLTCLSPFPSTPHLDLPHLPSLPQPTTAVCTSFPSENAEPSSLHSSYRTSSSLGNSDVQALSDLFGQRLPQSAISFVYEIADRDLEKAVDCVVGGPQGEDLLQLLGSQLVVVNTQMLIVRDGQFWKAAVAFYKDPSRDLTRPLQIEVVGQPVVDAGGVLRQFYTDVFHHFANNTRVNLFAGSDSFLRPYYSAGAYFSGLFRHLGRMISHSLVQCAVGFPYLSPYCFWYIVSGEDEAMQHVTLADVGADVSSAVEKVRLLYDLFILFASLNL